MGARSLVALISCTLAAACTGVGERALPENTNSSGGSIPIFHAETAIQDLWEHMPVKGETEYRLAVVGDQVAIRAVGQKSASGLLRLVDLDPHRCPIIEWSWRVTRLQASADLATRQGDDVAASIFLLFGDPGLPSSPNRVPTLRYVWTNDRHPVGAVIDNPYLPGTVRNVVVESGASAIGRWVTEKRDLRDDFQAAFGRRPEGPVRAIALFTDNDQTGEPVEAYYGWARAICGAEPRG